MGFLPKDYVGVNVRIDQFHEKYPKGSIETSFEINGNIVIFKTKVLLGENDRSFTGHSFGTVGKEKAFEKLETVSVGRALAFAGFETRDGIASKEEMEVFADNQYTGAKITEHRHPRTDMTIMDYVTAIGKEKDLNALKIVFEEALEVEMSESQREMLISAKDTRKKYLMENTGNPFTK